MRVLVTGAGGFVGGALVPVLVGAGHRVIAVSRKPGGAMDGAEMRTVPDIGPETDWAEVLATTEAVIHLAARVHVGTDGSADSLARFRRVNTDGTRRLAEAAAAAGVRRFVFISTVKVMSAETDDRPFTEQDPPRPVDAYGLSKWEAEQALAGVAARTGMEVVILRPPLVYGPGVGGNFLSLLRLCRLNPPLPLGAVDNRRSMVYVGNLADAIRRCLERPEAAGNTYFVRDGEDVSTAGLIRRVAQALGRRARLFGVPAGFLRLAGNLAGNLTGNLTGRLGGKSAAVSRLIGSLQVDDGKIRLDLGWKPPFTMVQGLSETARWFRSRSEKARRP